MKTENLSTETRNEIEELEKENKKYKEITTSFDTEVNRLFNIIKEAYNYVDKNLLCIKDFEKEELLNILGKGLNNSIGDNDA